MKVEYANEKQLRQKVGTEATAPYLPRNERLTGFIQLWASVKYNFVSFDQVPDLNWDEVLTEYLPKVEVANTNWEYSKVLKHCLALLHDGHTSVSFPSEDQIQYPPPFQVRAIQGQPVISYICSSEALQNKELEKALLRANLKLGDVVTHINGEPVQMILDRDIYPFVSASTSQGRDLIAFPKLFLGQFGETTNLTISDLDGNSRDVQVVNSLYAFPASSFEWRYLDDKEIVYINLPTFSSSYAVRFFCNLKEKIISRKGLIIDMRENNGGDTQHSYALLSHLISQEVPGSKWKTRKYIPVYEAWGQEQQWHYGNHNAIMPYEGKRYSGPVIVLTGPATVSAAEDFVVAFQTSKRGLVIGQRTNGSTGQPLFVDLPGGGKARICTKRDTYPDGREFVGIGCIPDIEIEPTPKNIATRVDVVLERAIEAILSTKKTM